MPLTIFPLVVLAAWAYNRCYPRLVCHAIGHDASWVLGVALGHNRPACERCKQVIT